MNKEEREKISACLVVYNEEKVIGRCLESIKDLVDEIILVHDGECSDKTLEIARRYTENIFILPHTGESSLHRVFTYNKASCEWIFQIDADEYIDVLDHQKIFDLIKKANKDQINGFRFHWEMWNGRRAFNVRGFLKECLFRKNNYHYLAITHGWMNIDGIVANSGVTLHHRPAYNNIAWSSFFRKAGKWAPIHATFYFPEKVKFESFNIDVNKWIKFTEKVKKNLFFYQIFEPLKMFLGQLKSGLYTHYIGWQIAAQQFAYYFILYRIVGKMKREYSKKG
jgi:glycosyltransferase involved in cell wall biosynthesis